MAHHLLLHASVLALTVLTATALLGWVGLRYPVNHTGLEPWYAASVAVAALLLGVHALRTSSLGPPLLAAGSALLLLLLLLDRANLLVSYERWLQRGMPPPWR